METSALPPYAAVLRKALDYLVGHGLKVVSYRAHELGVAALDEAHLLLSNSTDYTLDLR